MGKRLIGSPKVFVRDSGLVHALLGLNSLDAVLSHPAAGSSWDGLVVKQLINAAPTAQAGFYRTSDGAEVDLVLEFRGGQTWVIEIKRSSAPTVPKVFCAASADLDAVRNLLVAPVEQPYSIKDGVEVMSPLLAATVISSQTEIPFVELGQIFERSLAGFPHFALASGELKKDSSTAYTDRRHELDCALPWSTDESIVKKGR